MKKFSVIALLCFLGLLVTPCLLKAQASVKVSGEVTTPLTITDADLQK